MTLSHLARALGGLFLLIGGALFVAPFFIGPIEIRIPESRVATEIDDRLPFETRRAGVEITVTHLATDFLEADAVAVALEADLAGFGLTGEATGATTTAIDYRDGAFYLADLSLDDLAIVPTGDSGTVLDDASRVGRALWDRALAEVVPDDPEDAAETAAAADRLAARLAPPLREVATTLARSAPVYELDSLGFWGRVGGLALREVRFTDEAAIAVLDPRLVVIRVVTWILIGLGSLAMALGTLAPSRHR